MKKKPAVGSFVVEVECVVRKSIVCENCTREQVKENPFAYSVDEVEIEMPDWKVLSVVRNE